MSKEKKIINGVEYVPKSVAESSIVNIRDDVSIATLFVGKYVICRSRNEGINAGTVVAADKTGVILKDCRRLWRHKGAENASWYEGVANHGLSDDSKISEIVQSKLIIEDYSLTLVADNVKEQINKKPAYVA